MAATGQTLQSSSTILSSSSSQSTQPHLELEEQLPRVRPLMDIKKLYQIIWKFKSCGSAAQKPTNFSELRARGYLWQRTDTVSELDGEERMKLLNSVHIRRIIPSDMCYGRCRNLVTSTALKWNSLCPYIIMIFIIQRISKYLLAFSFLFLFQFFPLF